jgi:hypothetical protein
MAYNRKNILTRIIEIQNITLEHTRRGVTQEWVYQNIVFPTYHISKTTYYSYMASTAKKEMQALEGKERKEKELKGRQLNCFEMEITCVPKT